MEEKNQTVSGIPALKETLARAREAQKIFAEYSQKQVDEIFRAAALAANHARLPLAQLATDETGMGVTEDKVIKNNYASEYIYNAYKHTKTCGIVERNQPFGTMQVAEPIGVIAAVIPTTNPTSTAIFKALLCLKTRNAVILSPHPRAKKCTIATAKIILEAARNAGAPEHIIQWVENPSLELTNYLMQSADLILATGGPGMVRAAYSSGKPALGVGAGNTPTIIDTSADISLAVNSILHSKTFDNGMICASEQSVIAMTEIYDAVKTEFGHRGAYFLTQSETEKLRQCLLVNGAINSKIVGQSAVEIAKIAGFSVAPETRVLIAEVTDATPNEPFAHEKLSPILAMYQADSFETAMDMADRLIRDGGYGHTASLYANEIHSRDHIEAFAQRMKACRIVINTPASHGGIGDLYNFNLAPSMTLGCGSWGGNSISDNVGVKHLLNIKTVAERRENMLWFRTPQKVYFKKGCLPIALRELGEVLQCKRAFLVTDQFLFQNGMTSCVTRVLQEMEIPYQVFSDVQPDPTLACAKAGAAQMQTFQPDVILALGGGSAMDAAKIMWVLYEHPDADFQDMAMRFLDIRKRTYTFPKMGEKAFFAAIPTSSGTGSEVTPFAVITDESDGTKYPLADYALLPNMAIIDTDLMMSQPKGLTAAAGIDALTHALEAYASMMATDYTDSLALGSLRLIFAYLPDCYQDGTNPVSREKMANASTMAGMAFANAFLGVCHSMAHKLGAFHHLPHGVANAILISEVMRFNIHPAPQRMGTFSQYPVPNALTRYAQCASFLGIPGETEEEQFEGLLAKIEELKELVGIRPTIRDYGIKEEDFLATLDTMCQQAFDDQCTGANPRYPLISEIREMYCKAYYGK